jgi:hypothetical protein
MQLIHTQRVLKPTSVGSSFLFDAQIKVKLVAKVRKYNHQTLRPNIRPGTMIMALATHDTNSTVL